VSLRDLDARIARQVLGDATRGAEPITYHFASGAEPRTFNAHVRRLFLEPSTPQSSPVKERRCDVEFPRCPTDDLGPINWASGDKIELPVAVGEEPTKCRVKSMLQQDAARIILQVTE